MGKRKFNAKARQNVETIVDDTATKKIKIDLPDNSEYGGGYDDANALVLPSEKRLVKQKKQNHHVTRILSKKQRKKLEKVVDKKKKKENRASLLAALASVQVSGGELKKYTSISAIQTMGLKKLNNIAKNSKFYEKDSREDNTSAPRISGTAGRKKRLALAKAEADSDDSQEDNKAKKSINAVAWEESTNTSESESENESNIEQNKAKDEAKPAYDKLQVVENKTESINEKNTVNEETPIIRSDPIAVQPAVYVHVDRDPAIQVARLKLPILAEEQMIMETISENSIVIIAGETGSGKTTQLPQFLYEAGYAKTKLIGITEPRRVAAISMSKRVAREMNLSEKEVSYLIRFEGNVTDTTQIKFMTDGVLLKEIEHDFLLKKYSVIILDEAHERSVYTDILIGLLSRIVPMRNKKSNTLKLIIMSATLRVEDFINNPKLFKIPPPVVNVEARQFQVTVHFQKNTAKDYVHEAYRKVVKIHSKLPEGGILIFVTGQQEVKYLIRKLRKSFPFKLCNKNEEKKGNAKEQFENQKKVTRNELNSDEEDFEFDMLKAIKRVKKAKKKLAAGISLPKIDLDSYNLPTEDTDADLMEVNYGDDNDLGEDGNGNSDVNSNTEDDVEDEIEMTKQPLWVLPLYSLLSSEKQGRIFEPIPDGCRLCVVSTNLAETSLTIPNIKYVVDTGRQKVRLYDKITGVSAFVVKFTSKASANQRAGRAGRVSAGHCYRLYSSAVYNDEFEEFPMPDIQKKPVDDLVLQMKCMGIDKVINFPFPSPPDHIQLEVAERRLKLLGALEEVPFNDKDIAKTGTKVTPLGIAISAFSVAPRYGKMLALSHQQNLLQYTVCLVAALSVQEVLVEVSLNEEQNMNRTKWLNIRRAWVGTGNSLLLGDPMVLLRAVGASEYAGSMGELEEFCAENGLRSKAIIEIRKLRIQLTNDINLNIPGVNLCVDPQMQPPSDRQAKFLRQILLAGMGDMVARKIPADELKDKEAKRKYKYAYNCAEMEEPVFMHAASVLRKQLPEWVIYSEVYELHNDDSRKMFMRGITAIEPEWLLTYAPSLCNLRSIREDPPPRYNKNDGKIYCFAESTFGRAGWELPISEVEMPIDKACLYFGMFFLNGEVFPKLLKYKNKLTCTPSSVVKSWANLNEFISAFTKALIRKQVNCREKILNIWKSEPNYLLTHYRDLLNNVDTSEISVNWPPND